MPGPTPKAPQMRQRRNKTSTAATLAMDDQGRGVSGRIAPPLPARAKDQVPWHPETIAYWTEVWASPMAAEYLPADVPGLVGLMKLVDGYNYGDMTLAAEIRLQRQCFGLTPIDRRRLQWETERGESAERRRARQAEMLAAAPAKGARDPRKALRMVK